MTQGASQVSLHLCTYRYISMKKVILSTAAIISDENTIDFIAIPASGKL